jgi:hypothetical protein
LTTNFTLPAGASVVELLTVVSLTLMAIVFNVAAPAPTSGESNAAAIAADAIDVIVSASRTREPVTVRIPLLVLGICDAQTRRTKSLLD